MMKAKNEVLLDIKGLTMDYVTHGGLFGRNKQTIRVLDGLDLQIFKGETLGIVGESGCGKSTLGNSIMRFIKPTAGEVIYHERDVLKADKKALRNLRRHMQMVFQNPHASLNPRMRIFEVVAEPLRTHLLHGAGFRYGRGFTLSTIESSQRAFYDHRAQALCDQSLRRGG
jgi:peptide/nickel transport system ATP-binding protein